MNPKNVALVCSPENDLYRVLSTAGQNVQRYDTSVEAVARSEAGQGIAILADGYPARRTTLPEAVLDQATKKTLRLYIEYPATLPGLEFGRPETDKHLRGVVTSDFFGPALEPMRIVLINGCTYVPVTTEHTHLVLAKVAGVDTAVFGLQDTPTTALLFEHACGVLLVATTQLSQFVTGRYLPEEAWRTVWQAILRWLQPLDKTVPELLWTATVRPHYGRNESLPTDVEAQALHRSANWVIRSRILRHPQWPRMALDWSFKYNTVKDMPGADWPIGDGSLGVLEGFSSTIHADGTQAMRYAVRADCAGEVAMLMALDGHVSGRTRHRTIAANLVDYVLFQSGLATRHRSDVSHPSGGLIGWELDRTDYWGDDNGRALLGMWTVAALQEDSRWDDVLARILLANLRTTGVYGFRERCLDDARLEKNGWRHYWQSLHVDYSPHMQAWLWACFLWAHTKTGFEPFLTRAETGARMLMEAYPKWDYTNGSGALELARALLPLAWLVRVKDTPEHRGWLCHIATDLIALQDASGAVREIIRPAFGAYKDCLAKSNAAYGACETSLIQSDGDPIADMLYTCNFALIGLHEATAATGEALYAEAEEKLAKFLCRIQVQSELHPEFDGAWFRAFNFGNWQYWASNADSEWGAWCTETGWTQPWIAGALALRQMKTSLWELTQRTTFSQEFGRLQREMLPVS
jgi:hypothetical protein